jgi:hypothetical protein
MLVWGSVVNPAVPRRGAVKWVHVCIQTAFLFFAEFPKN